MVEQGITGDSQGWYGTISDKLQCGTIISVAEQVLDECEGLQQEYVFDVCEAPVFDHSDLEYPFYFDCCRQFTIPHSSDSTTRPTGRMRKLQIETTQRPTGHHERPLRQLSREGQNLRGSPEGGLCPSSITTKDKQTPCAHLNADCDVVSGQNNYRMPRELPGGNLITR